MSNTVALIIVVAVVVVIAVVAVLLVRTRGQDRRTRQAHELRTRAAAQSVELERARRRLVQMEAQQEETIREADRLDPSVDDRSEDYEPQDIAAPRQRP
jgi:uncharacterized protein HemX